MQVFTVHDILNGTEIHKNTEIITIIVYVASTTSLHVINKLGTLKPFGLNKQFSFL